jgi:hypothetical protein
MPTKGASNRKSGIRHTARRRATAVPAPSSDAAGWDLAWRELRRRGLVLTDRPKTPPPENPGFTPIRVEGEPLSETIIRERR